MRTRQLLYVTDTELVQCNKRIMRKAEAKKVLNISMAYKPKFNILSVDIYC